MQQRLTDTERTLLSAYLDGELSAGERRSAEALIEASPSARAYVADLRMLNTISVAAFPAAGASTVAGASAAGKLTSSAIKAAAEKGVVTKGLLTGGWGIAGMTTAAVAVVAAGVMLVTPSSEPTTSGPEPRSQAIESPSHATVPARAMTALDTTSVIVPEMTPAELVSFAVNGTLPIDEKRERFISVADTSSLAPMPHAELPAILNRELVALDPARIRGLDSMQDVVRTSLLNCSGNRIAIRNDIGTLRLQVLRQIEADLAPRLPDITRQRLSEVRRAVEVEARAIEQQARIVEKQAQEIEAGVRYLVLPERSFQSAPAGTPVCFSPRFFNRESGTTTTQVIFVQNNSLDGLRRQLQSMPTAVAAVASDERRAVAAAGASAGVSRPARYEAIGVRRTSTPNPPAPDRPESLEEQMQQQPDSPAPPRHNSVTTIGGSSLNERDIERMLEGVQRKLDRVDSILKSVDKKIEKETKKGVEEDGGE